MTPECKHPTDKRHNWKSSGSPIKDMSWCGWCGALWGESGGTSVWLTPLGRTEELSAERERCFNEVARLQEEAHNELEKIGGEPLMKVKDRFKAANRQAWSALFSTLTKLKWFIDPSKAPTSTVEASQLRWEAP